MKFLSADYNKPADCQKILTCVEKEMKVSVFAVIGC